MIEAGLPLVIVQPGPIYGPGDTSLVHTILAHYLQRKQPLLPTATAFSYVHVDDAARGHMLAMEKGRPGECYNLTGDIYTLVETMRLAEKITGVPTPRIQASRGVLKMLSATMSVVEKLLPVPDEYSAEFLRILFLTMLITSRDKQTVFPQRGSFALPLVFSSTQETRKIRK
jgi:nucleoside-diphosphate-sugar epimerase